ncbi:hypothetical protein SAMN05444156_3254 [Verrucomicrobium sp. GAS474]|uniref:hypothetical protein n=1 Tax=Verrucomicrobium sp. GAS474 TaxID=1882831 RepID=UPI00087B1BD4|nr:hypothetical protein [Verrucomicrobium sp. GAS474]SDT85678.1 hypothetical protein SAMN05444156_0016 [Verrucomicrobium sp. GAS474]SDU31656.1 hypothetical protein SAMN05444156_3254 [Verrucomicrobium sp. GAS474]
MNLSSILKDAHGGEMTQANFRMPRTTKKRMDAICKAHGVSASLAIRRLVMGFVDSYDAQAPKRKGVRRG